jgi:hypothetical protein
VLCDILISGHLILGPLQPLVTAIERPVAAIDGDAMEAALGAIVVNLQIAVVRVTGQGLPPRNAAM